MSKHTPCKSYQADKQVCRDGFIQRAFCSGRVGCLSCGNIGQNSLPYCMSDELPAHMATASGAPLFTAPRRNFKEKAQQALDQHAQCAYISYQGLRHNPPAPRGVRGRRTTMTYQIPQELIDCLPESLDVGAAKLMTLREALDLGGVEMDYHGGLDDNSVVVIAPGFVADDGGAEIEYPDAASGHEAAQEYADGGDYTESVTVTTWRAGYVLDNDGDCINLQLQRQDHKIAIEPVEPECSHADGHDWQNPISVVGGIDSNPGCYGHGGGVIMKEVCAHCGAYKTTDSWAQDMSVRYDAADDESLEWIRDRAESVVRNADMEAVRQALVAMVGKWGADAQWDDDGNLVFDEGGRVVGEDEMIELAEAMQ